MRNVWLAGDIALVLCLAALGSATEARAADCQHVRGTITETVIPSPYDPFGRTLGIVEGVLNGVSTASITSVSPDGTATSADVFVTNRGDMLTAVGAVTLTPVQGAPGDFTANVTLTVTGEGTGRYAGAHGTIVFEGQAHNFDAGPGLATADIVYRGSVCGPHVKHGGH
jgi:hypothetical protein